MSDASSSRVFREPNGRFAKGNPGGPGRPRKPVSVVARELDLVGAEVALELMRNIVEQARAGNLAATAMVLKRIWPVRRNRPIELDPLPGDGLRNLHADHAALAAAMMNGDITPQEGEPPCACSRRCRSK